MATDRKSISESLRTYWWSLIGLALFPSVLGIGEGLLHVPFGYFIPVFFVVIFLAFWPSSSGRAPFSFALVAGGVWLTGGILGVCVTSLIRAFFF